MKVSGLDLKKVVLKAVDEYNRFRSPEAKAKLIKIRGKEIILDFEGSFCRTCGVYDYFEDFVYELKKIMDINLKIKNFEEYKPEIFRVKYVIVNP
jgi:hypothetical protein